MLMSGRYNTQSVSLILASSVKCPNCENPGQKEAHKKLKACQKKGAITCPDGTAGRHFNLQHAMKLDDKDTVYKKIRVSAFFLSTWILIDFLQYKIIEIAKDNGLRLETTIRYQPPTLLGTIITLVRIFYASYMHICTNNTDRRCSKSHTWHTLRTAGL
jgi:hypothetical protein